MTNFFSNLLGIQPPENVLSEEARKRLAIPETPAVKRMGTEFTQKALQPESRNFFADIISKETRAEAQKQKGQLPVFKQIAKVSEFLKPKSEEEAGKMGLVRFGNTYFDITGVSGGLKDISVKALKTVLKVTQRGDDYFLTGTDFAGRSIRVRGTKEFVEQEMVRARGISQAISKELEPLAQEARKFKSAEEFVEGMWNKLNVEKTEIPGFPKGTKEGSIRDASAKIRELLGTKKKLGGWFDDFTDFYNQAVKGVKEVGVKIERKILPVKEQLKPPISRSVADEAIRFAKENPESSLVAKEFRDPRTKELISGPRLFKRIGESLENGEIRIDDLPEMAKYYGLGAEETAKLFEDAATYSGRTLQALSRVEKELRNLLPDIQIAKRELTLWERFKSGYLAVDNFRRGLLVTQMATAARNAISQTGRYALGTITDGMSGVISKLIGKGVGFTPFFEDIAAILRKTKSGNLNKIQGILRKFPIESARLYNTPVSDVALSGKITNTLNILNRGQEYFFRNLIMDAKLHTAAKIKGVPIEKLGIDDVAGAVGEALEWTFSKSPIRGSFGDSIMRLYRAMPPLTLINPFPRFMSNAVKFLYDYSPLGIMSLFKGSTRAAIAAGDYATISKAIVGTSMLGGAIAIRANKNIAGEKWYEIKVGNKVIDTRPFAPFSTYLFFAEIMANGTEGISGSDWAQAAIGINRVAGTGLALVDLIGNKVDYKNVKQVVGNIISTYIGGFTVPFVTIKDIIGNFRLEERTIKETREIPIIGGAIGNIPGLQELLPTKYSMFQDKPLEREWSLLRQFTGLTLTTKPYIQKELDRMGKDIGDLVPKTGNLEANRIISKQTGVILDEFNGVLEMSKKYQAMSDNDKLEFVKALISEAKKEAKGEVASDLAGVVYNELKKVKPNKRAEIVKELKGRGLMTENILDYLLPMMESQPLPK